MLRGIIPHMDLTNMRFASTALRGYVSASIFTTCYIAWSIPDSITARALLQGQPVGKVILFIAMVFSTIALIDTIINEFKWVPFSLGITKRWRQLGFMILSIVSASAALLVLLDHGPHPVIVRYILDSCAAVIVAVLGLRDLLQQPFPHTTHAV